MSINDRITIENIQNIESLDIDFCYPDSKIIVITGKNGIGKTSIIRTFGLISDPGIFQKSASLSSITKDSRALFRIQGFPQFQFDYNHNLNALDTRDNLPLESDIIAELSIPFGKRFQQFSLVASYDQEIRSNIAASDYEPATNMIHFLNNVYSTDKFSDLKSTLIGKNEFYFFLLPGDFYIREDHFSSGEFFLIQLYRLVTSGAKLILIDEVDVALDASAQVNLYLAIQPLLKQFESRLILITHSLAFLQTVDDGGIYYLEKSAGHVSLEQKSFGYIKSDLYGFSGFERYILTEDEVLEGFIRYTIYYFSVSPHYQFTIIGVAGVNQLEKIVRKNDECQIFTNSENVLCIVDADSVAELHNSYNGPTAISASPVSDIESFIYANRNQLLPEVPLPDYDESTTPKRASKTYWKWLIRNNSINTNQLYKLVLESNLESARTLRDAIKDFLELAP